MPEVVLDGCRLHYQMIDGRADRACLVFLHEGLGSVAMWGDYPLALCRATGCAGLLYDRRGYGRSSPAAGRRTIHYLHEAALHELPALLDRVLPAKEHVLVGHSDGGSIALIAAAGRPPLLRGVIVEAAHVFVDAAAIGGIEAAVSAWRQGKLEGLARYHEQDVAAVFAAWSETWLSEWFRHWNIEYLLPSIVVPLMAIQGKNDQYGLPAQVEAICGKASGPTRRAMIDGCGHAPHHEARSAVLALMTEFIDGLKGDSPASASE